MTVFVSVSSGQKELRYYTTSGTSGADGSGNVNIYLGTAAGSTSWQRFERRIEEDWDVYSAASYTNMDGLLFRPTATFSYDLHIDDIRLTNAVTVEHNTLGPGVIGHIMRHRTIDPSTMAATDRWFHYDQVGSILCETNSSGTHAQRHDQDTFGNTLDTWQNGLIGGDQTGWHHNTKEYDADTGLVYMYQRWYSGDTGLFASASPLGRQEEPLFSAFAQSPLNATDTRGLTIEYIGDSRYHSTIDACLNKFSSCSAAVRNMIEFLRESPRHHSIRYGPHPDGWGGENTPRSPKGHIGHGPWGSNSVVDPQFRFDNGNQMNVATMCATLIHELAHAFDRDRGLLDKTKIDTPMMKDFYAPSVKEFRAMLYENEARACLGLPTAFYGVTPPEAR